MQYLGRSAVRRNGIARVSSPCHAGCRQPCARGSGRAARTT